MCPSSLSQLFPQRQTTTSSVELLTYEVDAGFDRGRPQAVVFPESSVDVCHLLRWAAEQGMAVVARGAGTGLSGGAVAEHGGVILEFARMNRVLEFDSLGRSALVEPGVVNLKFDALAKQSGLYYPPDPSSGRASLLGGNLGENAGGPHCFKYGVTTNYVTGLEIVLAGGVKVTLGGRALDYPEYDLAALVVGSEGTLAAITRAELRLIRNPPGVKTLMCSFPSDEAAGAAVSAVIAAGLAPATLEMMDQKVMRMIEDFVQVGLPVNAQIGLIVEVDGYPASLDAQIEEIAVILQRQGAYDLRVAQSEAERQRIWYGRKSAAGAFSRLAPAFYLVDVTVPRSKLAETLAAVNRVCERYALRVGHVFHAGDGNLHPAILCDPADKVLMQAVFAACEEIVALSIAQDGSITGEHGVGIEKRQFMPMMYSGNELAAMLDIKHVFDPSGLMNPGKIFPDVLPPVALVAPAMPDSALFTPDSAVSAAAQLLALTQARQTVHIGCAKDGQRSASAYQLSTHKLGGVRSFAPDDLTITVGSGMSCQELDAFLAQSAMQTALASPWPEATVGGLLSSNVNAPHRIRYGSLRDNLLCATVALADGRVIRAGRPVVKNVAGYDLPKVFVGAQGTLGLLVDATLKLTPRPRTRRTFALSVGDLAQGVAWAQTISGRLLATSGLILQRTVAEHGSLLRLTCTVEGLPEDVAAEVDELRAGFRAAGAPDFVEADGASAVQIWQSFLADAANNDMTVRIGVPAKDLRTYMESLPPAVVAQARWLVDAPCGLVYAAVAVDGSVDGRAWLASVRAPALRLGGYALVVALPEALVGVVDRWGYRPQSLALMQRLKAVWDPAGILNPEGWIAASNPGNDQPTDMGIGAERM